MVDQDVGDLNDFIEFGQDLAVGIGSLANSLPGINSAYQAFCRVAAGTPGGIVLGLARVDNVCSPYLNPDGRTFGDEEPLPFTGGQCPELYDLSANYTLRRDGVVIGNNILTGSATGPIGFREVVERPSSNIVRREGRYLNGAGEDFAQYIIRQEETLSGGVVRVTTGELSNFSLSRRDGGQDNCGNGDPYYRPGDNYGGEGYGEPQLIVGPDGNGRSITVSPPEFGDDGGLSIPVTIDGVEINLGGGEDGGGGGGYNPGPTETGPGSGAGSGDGPQQVPPGPEGTRCIAVAVDTVGRPNSAGEVASSAPPARTYGALGNISVRLATDDGSSYWSEDTVIFQEKTVKTIPVEGFTIEAWRLVLAAGMTATVTPIYRSDSV